MISIIIPIYNHAKFLPETFESILKQTYKDIDVIAVDDGSADNSLAVANSYQEKFLAAKISYQVLKHEENKGAPKARNTGFKTSKGEFLLFCDADAIFEENALALMLQKLKDNPQASYAYPSFMWGNKLFKGCEFDPEKLKKMPYIHTMALIRREHFPGFDESIKKFQDWDLWLTMLEKGYQGVWIDQVLFQVHPGGTMSSWLPAFAYKYFPFLKAVKQYNDAKERIKNKHRL